MKKLLIPLCIGFLFNNYVFAQYASLKNILAKDTLLGHRGLSATVIFPNGNVWTDVIIKSKTKNIIADSTLFYGGSTTKTFVAARILQLAKQNLLHLDSSYTKYISAIKNIDKSITVKHLLTHTSGVYEITDHPNFMTTAFLNDTKKYTIPEVYTNFLISGGSFTPGTSYKYTNTDYLVLGQIIEAITKKDLNTDLRAQFLTPLALKKTYWGDTESYPKPTAGFYIDLLKNGIYTDKSSLTMNALLSGAKGAGNIVSTPHDLALWIRALISEAATDADIVKQMKTPTSHSITANDLRGSGLSIKIIGNDTLYGHNGDIGNITRMYHCPKTNISIVVCSNTRLNNLPAMEALYTEVVNIVAGIEENSFTEKSIYPNPTSNNITLPITASFVEVFNLLGERVLYQFNTNEINLSEIQAGTYMLKITTGDHKIVNSKIVKN